MSENLANVAPPAPDRDHLTPFNSAAVLRETHGGYRLVSSVFSPKQPVRAGPYGQPINRLRRAPVRGDGMKGSVI
jgi:hypothetical protein